MTSLEEKIGQILIDNKLTAATAESCTGGLVSSRLTDVPGSSSYIHLNFVTYANHAKQEILGVKADTLKKYGAVSEQCAYEMVQGLQKRTKCDLAICTTGIAGPTDEGEKPAGLIYIGIAFQTNIYLEKVLITEKLSKTDMKIRFADKALELALKIISKEIQQ